MDDLGWERIASGGKIENISLSDLAEPYASKGSGTDCIIGSSIGSDDLALSRSNMSSEERTIIEVLSMTVFQTWTSCSRIS